MVLCYNILTGKHPVVPGKGYYIGGRMNRRLVIAGALSAFVAVAVAGLGEALERVRRTIRYYHKLYKLTERKL